MVIEAMTDAVSAVKMTFRSFLSVEQEYFLQFPIKEMRLKLGH
jgi:hypothetical protein